MRSPFPDAVGIRAGLAALVAIGCRGPTPVAGPPDLDGKRSSDHAQYEVIDLGTLGGTYSTPNDVNRRGQVVGYSTTADGTSRAFLWHAGSLTDLGTLGGTWSAAEAINDRGVVAGQSATAAGERHAFLWSDGVMHDLGPAAVGRPVRLNRRGQVAWTMPTPDGNRAAVWMWGTLHQLGALGGSGESNARGINDRGYVVGQSNGRPFVWNGDAMRELATLGGLAWAADINNRGDVVGASYSAEQPGYAFAMLWRGAGYQRLGPLPEDRYSSAEFITDAGWVVAHSYPFSWYPQRAFIWDQGTMTPLATPNAYYAAADVNNRRIIVGQDRIGQGHRYMRAAVWEDGVKTLLPLLDGDESSATAVNGIGLIAGWARTEASHTHAVLWRDRHRPLAAE